MDFGTLFQTMQSEDGLKNIMLQPAFENEAGVSFSQAELIADVINILRLDTKRLAEAQGVDVSVQKMSPDRAAELLQGVAKGTDNGLIDIFDDIENDRMRILAQIEGEDAAREYGEMKIQMLHTVPDDYDVTAALEDGGIVDMEVDDED